MPPETITIDGSAANEAAIKSYNQEHGTSIVIRKTKYLKNIVEQDHRAVKRVTRPMLGFKSFTTAHNTLVGTLYEYGLVGVITMIALWSWMFQTAVFIAFQIPWRSGWPSGVRGGVQLAAGLTCKCRNQVAAACGALAAWEATKGYTDPRDIAAGCAGVLTSSASMGVPVKPMKEALGSASRM